MEFALDERLQLAGLDPVFSSDGEEEEAPPPVVQEPNKVGRTIPCPCGSGKKYK